MPATTSTEIAIPSLIASSIHLTDVACNAIKLLLIAESERPDGSDTADIPIARVRAMADWTPKTLHETIARLAGLRTRWAEAPVDPIYGDAGGQPLMPFAPFVEAPRARYVGRDERVTVRFSEEWVSAARGLPVVIRLDELRAYSWRSGVLLRLRAGAMLGKHDKIRFKLVPSEFSLLSGCPEHTPPGVHLDPHLPRGISDIAQHSSTVSVDGVVSARNTGHVTGVWMTARRVHRRPIRSTAREPKAAPVHPSSPAG